MVVGMLVSGLGMNKDEFIHFELSCVDKSNYKNWNCISKDSLVFGQLSQVFLLHPLVATATLNNIAAQLTTLLGCNIVYVVTMLLNWPLLWWLNFMHNCTPSGNVVFFHFHYDFTIKIRSQFLSTGFHWTHSILYTSLEDCCHK